MANDIYPVILTGFTGFTGFLGYLCPFSFIRLILLILSKNRGLESLMGMFFVQQTANGPGQFTPVQGLHGKSSIFGLSRIGSPAIRGIKRFSSWIPDFSKSKSFKETHSYIPRFTGLIFRILKFCSLNLSTSHFENIAVREASSLEKSWQNATHTVFGNECGPIMRIAVLNLPVLYIYVMV